MGLDLSHGDFSCSYGTFSHFRQAVEEAAGLAPLNYSSYPEHAFNGEWNEQPDEPLIPFFVHSDCDGHLEVAQLVPLLPRLKEFEGKLEGRAAELLIDFIGSVAEAIEAGERLEFC